MTISTELSLFCNKVFSHNYRNVFVDQHIWSHILCVFNLHEVTLHMLRWQFPARRDFLGFHILSLVSIRLAGRSWVTWMDAARRVSTCSQCSCSAVVSVALGHSWHWRAPSPDPPDMFPTCLPFSCSASIQNPWPRCPAAVYCHVYVLFI